MGENSKIEWTDVTWNPLAGCTRASAGCDNCYAASMALRLEAMAQADVQAGRDPGAKHKYIGVAVRTPSGRAAFNGTIRVDESALQEPFRWRRPRRVFVNSMSDLFHASVPEHFMDQVFAVMALNPQHTFQVLTKRPQRMAQYTRDAQTPKRIADAIDKMQWADTEASVEWPLSNFWAGTSVEDQLAADQRIPELIKVAAPVRFLSCEPLLGPIDLGRAIGCGYYCDEAVGHVDHPFWTRGIASPLEWVIIGGESGPGARPMEAAWARSLVEQCRSAGVAPFVKQMGTVWAREHGAKDAKGGNWEEWEEQLRVREMPDGSR